MSALRGHGHAAEVLPRAEPVAGFCGLEREWDALAVPSGGIFATALFHRLWWNHFGGGRELLLHAARASDGSLAAVIPLYAWRRRLPRTIRFLGHGPGDELGPVHARGEQAAAAQALRAVLDTLQWNVFVGEQLPGAEDWSRLLGGREWRREANPTLSLPSTWKEYLAQRSANFRQQLRRRETSLARACTVKTRLADEGSIDADLDTLFALHRARWGSSPTDFADTPFHRDVAVEALRRGWLRLWLLELDGRPVAAWHGFKVGSVASYYQAGRDPALDRYSIGFVLMAHTIRSAIEEGAATYRFGRGDEAFKFRFTDEDHGLETVMLTRGLPSRALALGAAAAAAARRATRRRLR